MSGIGFAWAVGYGHGCQSGNRSLTGTMDWEENA